MKAQKRNRGFTLVELLVVIGIIAVLIGILLPALGKAREQAKTVQCASNLHQMHLAIMQYAATYNNACLPAQASQGSSQMYSWWGTQILGRLMGVKQIGNSSASTTEALARISKLLHCPSVERTPTAGINYTGDYTYNNQLGDWRSAPPSSAANILKYAPLSFKKRNQVPDNVAVMMDAHDGAIVDEDDRFGSLSQLTVVDSTTSAPPRAGHPHKGKANVLFQDGSIRLIKAFTPVPPKNDPLPTAFDAKSTDLQSWMILSPASLNTGTVFHTDKPTDVWQKGRELPF